MNQPDNRPGRAERTSAESSSGTWRSRFGLLVIDKLILAGVTAGAILFFQHRLQLSQERLEKAKHISEILIDMPVSIGAKLPADLDAFILYAEQIRSRDLEQISSERLTELQARISSDLEGSRAYYSSDPDLKKWAVEIRKTIYSVQAKALIRSSLGAEDLTNLEEARQLAYSFHRRIIDLSVQQALKQFDTAYERRSPV